MSSFIDIAPSPGRFTALGTNDKVLPLSSEDHAVPYAYVVQHHHHAILDVDPTSGLSFPPYRAYQGGIAPFVYDPSAAPESLYSHWTV
jgi:hypothetical protein